MNKHEEVYKKMHADTLADGHERLYHVLNFDSLPVADRDKFAALLSGRPVIVGNEHSVRPDTGTMLMMVMFPEIFEGAVHTHPATSSGLSFSSNDIIEFINSDRPWTEVITSEGYVDRLTKTASFNHSRVEQAFPRPADLSRTLIGFSDGNLSGNPEGRLRGIKFIAEVLGMTYERRTLDK